MSNFLKQTLLTLFCLIMLGCSDKSKTSYNGYIEARLSYLSTPLGGKLKSILVKRGDVVKKDQLLFTLDKQPEGAELAAAISTSEQALANLRNLEEGKRPSEIAAIDAKIQQATKQLAYLHKEYQRHQNLIKDGAVSQESLDIAKTNYLVEQARVEELKANLMTAKLPARFQEVQSATEQLNQSKAQVTKAEWAAFQKQEMAPEAGTIFDTFYRLGEYVPAGQPVISLLVPKQIKAIFFVPEQALSQIKLNQVITIDCDNCKQSTQAFISFISPIAEYTPPVIFSEKERSKLVYRIEADFHQDSPVSLTPGQPVDVQIHMDKA